MGENSFAVTACNLLDTIICNEMHSDCQQDAYTFIKIAFKWVQ